MKASLKSFTFVFLLAVTSVLGAPSSAVASNWHSERAAVRLVADLATPVGDDGQTTGTFEATGPAARRGLVCPSGTVGGTITGPGASWYDFVFTYTFTCADGSGSFVVDLNVKLLDPEAQPFGTVFTWVVRSGEGEYTDLTGWGAGFALTSERATRDFFDIYTGWLS